MRGRLWTGAELDEVRRRRVAGEGWAQIALAYGVTSDAVRCAAVRGGFRIAKDLAPAAPASVAPPPAVHTSKSRAESYLVISDLQIPYHHPGALDFCKKVRFEFGVPLENVLCVGDEIDAYWGSRFEKSADAPHTVQQELDEAKNELARWSVAFPHMRLCNSNHGGRWAKMASRQGIPKSMLRDYRELLGTPAEWQWADHWLVAASKQRFRVEHGHWKPGGHSGLRTRPLFRGCSVAWGHEHAEPATIHIDTYGPSVWGMRVGSLISKEPVPAFEYNTEDSYRPTASVGVVLDGGRLPVVVRM